MSSVLVDTIDWHTEAEAVIKDVKDHVNTIAISEKLITGEKKKVLCVKSFC